MGFWSSLKGHTFLKVIEWQEDGRPIMVFKFPVDGGVIADGSKLVVAESQSAVFMQEGVFSEPFDAGTYDLHTRTSPIWSFFETIKYGFDEPYKGEVFFLSRRQFMDQKWGTPGPIPLEDPKFGMVNIRAFGEFGFRISDPLKFLREIVGNQNLFSTEDIGKYLKSRLASAFVDTLAEAEIPFLKLARNYTELGEDLCKKMSPPFEERFGIELTDFLISRISLPPKVQEMMDKVSSMNMVDDMAKFTQFQAANAIEQSASNPGGGNSFMDAGVGMAMGNMMGNMVQPPQAGHAAPPPPPVSSGFHYNGAGGQGQFSASEIANKVALNRSGAHNVWMQGWDGWKSWKDVPEIAGLVPPPQAPPAHSAGGTYHYNGPSGQGEFTAVEVAKKLNSDPDGRHLVWQSGFSEWKPADQVADIQAQRGAGGPPPLPSQAPPPIPNE